MWRNILPLAEMSKQKHNIKVQFSISKQTPRQLTSLHSLNNRDNGVVTDCIVKSRETQGYIPN